MFFDIIAIVITITAIFSFLNVRHFGLPSTIGVLAISLVFSALVIVAGKVGIPLDTAATGFLRRIYVNRVLLHGLLAYLLFAGGLNLKISQLSDRKGAIALLSTLGVAISTLVFAGGTWLVFSFARMPIPPEAALLFGALISQTDPVAVLAILRTLAIPPSLEAKLGGESFFKDGVGAVVFMVLLQIATSPVQRIFSTKECRSLDETACATFWSGKTPQQTASDLTAVLRTFMATWHAREVALIGYSFGADVMPFAYNRLPDSLRSHVALIALLGFSKTANFQITVTGWLGELPGADALSVLPETDKIPSRSMQCFHGQDEKDTDYNELARRDVEIIRTTGGHHFDGDYNALARRILAGFERRVGPLSSAMGRRSAAFFRTSVSTELDWAVFRHDTNYYVALLLWITHRNRHSEDRPG